MESVPTLRRPPGAEQTITFDQIMDALCRLDDANRPIPAESGHRHMSDRLDA